MYSNAVKIAGLNDYLNPSEECVLPLVKNDNKYEIKINDKNSDSFNIKNRNKSGKNPLDDDIYKINNLKVGNVDKNKRITVGLSDCLSCSGCLTSSEEILLKDDNHLRVLEKMKESESCVVSISPQTIFMFSSYYDEKPQIVLRKLSYFFRKLGANMVFDIGLSELLSLNKSKEEFISRYLKQNNNNKDNNTNNNNTTNKDKDNKEDDKNDNNNDCIDLPIITSHCPGWTLYAEKTLEQELVDKISKVPSSQVIQGLLVKTLCHTMNYFNRTYEYNYVKLLNPYLLFDNRLGLCSVSSSTLNSSNKQAFPFSSSSYQNFISSNHNVLTNDTNSSNKVNQIDKVYHICVVPCYDKKFEMVRSEYQLDSNILSLFCNNNKDNKNNKDNNTYNKEKESLVDDILSTGDIGKILDELKIDFGDLKEQEIDYLFDYIYYFNKFVTFKLFNTNNNTNSNNTNKDNTHNNTDNNNNKDNNKDYFDSYRDCLEKTNPRDLLRCSELYCQSGGFAEEIFRHSCFELFSKPQENVLFKQTINKDFKECVLYDSNNNVLLRFIIAYGFKNIQNVIKLLRSSSNNKINNNNTNKDNTHNNTDNNNNKDNNNNSNNKAKPPVYHYIELMSCPGGCFNGAGQRIERSLVDNPGDTTKFNGYFDLIINKMVPKNYQNDLKSHMSEMLEKLQRGKKEVLDKFFRTNDNKNTNNKENNKDNKEEERVKEDNNNKQKKKNKKNSSNNTKIQQANIQTISSTAYEMFLKEAKYVSTKDPICQYFSNFLKLSGKLYDFNLNLNSHKNTNVSLKW